MWFKNLLIYRITSGNCTAPELETSLAKHVLRDCLQMELQSRGWILPKESQNRFVHSYNEHLLIAFSEKKKLLPATVINQYARDRITVMEQHQGYKPGKKQIRDIKEAVLIELTPRAFVQQQTTYAWIDTAKNLLIIDTANLRKAEELIELLIKTVHGLRIAPYTTKITPSAVMTRWLSGDEPPAVFTIDRDCELQSASDEKSIVRYAHHILEADETSRHIRAGKRVTRLALTWANKISFVLQDNLQIRRIAPLDIIKESTDIPESADDIFDSDFVLMTGEYSQLLPDLVHALGGEN